MASVTIDLPSLLTDVLGVARRIEITASTLAGALDALVAAHPSLRVHLFDETAGLRPHVLCLVNGENSRWCEGRDRVLEDGDALLIMQAVSGG